jgi:hypothetical protein
LHVPVKFSVPEIDVRSRPGGFRAVVLVPEAPVDEDRDSMASEHDVRLPRQILPLKSEAVAEAV